MFNILQMYKNNLLYQNIIKENYFFHKIALSFQKNHFLFIV